uniref:Uncharacterized protein n=1 Tax=Arundo donax TaxID=35708 RepID=A0A0A9BRW2_ARUDO
MHFLYRTPQPMPTCLGYKALLLLLLPYTDHHSIFLKIDYYKMSKLTLLVLDTKDIGSICSLTSKTTLPRLASTILSELFPSLETATK